MSEYSGGPSHFVGPSPKTATAGFSLQRSTEPFVNRSRGCENASSIFQTYSKQTM